MLEFLWNSVMGTACAPMEKIQFEGAHFRRDMAATAML